MMIQQMVSFKYSVFFNFLLPPIILNSGYELHQVKFTSSTPSDTGKLLPKHMEYLNIRLCRDIHLRHRSRVIIHLSAANVKVTHLAMDKNRLRIIIRSISSHCTAIRRNSLSNRPRNCHRHIPHLQSRSKTLHHHLWRVITQRRSRHRHVRSSRSHFNRNAESRRDWYFRGYRCVLLGKFSLCRVLTCRFSV